ncbi:MULTISPECIES: hypothetical protein [unclassified Polynucleobacter]|uniref:hypothetical protein n=1 Tax=unclassified Polynucleobacter TaxID=2640945 RepID=UPI0008B772D7|nr:MULTISPECIES: hypothetical protein [unclassified Polynucleobacter]OHC10418.1 MAG: hypothetical protein A2X74_00820 [Polynucleobacter sp. GWA2_45_21]HBK44256.1 hypothetical protein [Polynucleobacter sp.]
MKPPDKRCCGSGVCIINETGECWCGQVWDGEKMSAPPLMSAKSPVTVLAPEVKKTASEG